MFTSLKTHRRSRRRRSDSAAHQTDAAHSQRLAQRHRRRRRLLEAREPTNHGILQAPRCVECVGHSRARSPRPRHRRILGRQSRVGNRVRRETLRRAGDDLRSVHRRPGQTRRNVGARRRDRLDATALRRRDGSGDRVCRRTRCDVREPVHRRNASRRPGNGRIRDLGRAS